MASEWFYSINGTEHGPVSGKELAALVRSGKLKPTDLVWYEGLSDWQPARNVTGLFPVRATPALPPPLEPRPQSDDEHSLAIVSELLVRTQKLLDRVYDTTTPTTGLDVEVEELRQLARSHEEHLVRMLTQNKRERQESEGRVAALREVLRLKKLAREARTAGRSAEAARLSAEAARAQPSGPHLTEEERQAQAERLREQLELRRQTSEILTEANELLVQAAAAVEQRQKSSRGSGRKSERSAEAPDASHGVFGHQSPDWGKLGLWRFVALHAAVAGTFVAGILVLGAIATLSPKNKSDPFPWEGMFMFAALFALAAAVAVCVLPITAGRFWPERSEYLGRWGRHEFRVFLPTTWLGWAGYYLALGTAASCVFLLAVAAFAALFAAASATNTCRHCGAAVWAGAPICPHCGAVRP